MTTVTYNFANGAKQSQTINVGETYYNANSKQRSKNRPVTELFQDIASDLGAVGFTIDGEGANNVVIEAKEVHFTKANKKFAKFEYNQFKQRHSSEFAKEKQQCQSYIVDQIAKRGHKLRFNLRPIVLS